MSRQDPNRARLLADRAAVMRSYGWDPAEKSADARRQALKAFSHRMPDCDDTGRYAVYVRDPEARCVGRTDKEGNARELMRACVEDLGKPHAEVYDTDAGHVIAQKGVTP